MRWPSCSLRALALVAILAVPPGLALSLPASLHDEPQQPAPGAPALSTWATPGGAPRSIDGGLVLAPATPWKSLDAPQQLTFECPEGDPDALMGQTDLNVNVVRASCPFRIIDEADLLGSPQLAVRHDDPREVAFFSLHGAASGDGPTPRSRDPNGNAGSLGALSHTTFTSPDRGWNWRDNPYGDEGFGETNAGIMSRDGNMFIASLFAQGLGRGDDGELLYDYHFQLYKENTAKENPGYKGFKVNAREPGNRIAEVNLVLVTPPTSVETDEQYREYLNRTQEAEENGTTAPSDDDDVGNYTIPHDEEDFSKDLIVAVWHERALDWANATTGKSSWVDFLWTDASSRDTWHKIDDKQLVGPCRDASNPVSWNGRVYVACVVDAGYTGRRGARIGDVDIWSVDPVAGTKQYMSTVPGIADGRPRLAAAPDGRFAISVLKLEEVGDVTRPDLQLRFGWYGRTWDQGGISAGSQIEAEVGAAKLRDARVTAMVLLEDTHTLYLSFMERLNTTVQADPSVDPTGPSPPAAIEYRKFVSTWEHCERGPLALYDLQVGTARHPFEEGLVNDFTGVFDDLHDGMAVVRDPRTRAENVYFAYGDHGVIQYGIIHGLSGGGACTVPAPAILYTPVPAVPSPLLLSSGVSVGAATAAALPAAVGLGSLLIAKRRVALAAAAKAK